MQILQIFLSKIKKNNNFNKKNKIIFFMDKIISLNNIPKEIFQKFLIKILKNNKKDKFILNRVYKNQQF